MVGPFIFLIRLFLAILSLRPTYWKAPFFQGKLLQFGLYSSVSQMGSIHPYGPLPIFNFVFTFFSCGFWISFLWSGTGFITSWDFFPEEVSGISLLSLRNQLFGLRSYSFPGVHTHFVGFEKA